MELNICKQDIYKIKLINSVNLLNLTEVYSLSFTRTFFRQIMNILPVIELLKTDQKITNTYRLITYLILD